MTSELFFLMIYRQPLCLKKGGINFKGAKIGKIIYNKASFPKIRSTKHQNTGVLWDVNRCSVKKLSNKKCRSVINFMFFVPCIVIQLCNVNQQMRTFQIGVLIQFLASCVCFKHCVFIIRKNICTYSFVWYVYHTLM